MKNITNVLLVIFILLTVYNTFMIHSASAPEPVDMSDINAKINGNAAEIQTLEGNMETMVDFVNAKFESLTISVGE